MSKNRPVNPGQLSTTLPGINHYITGHDSEGKAVIHSHREGDWKPFDDMKMAFNQVYTTDFPADLNDDKDVTAHDDLIKSGTLGLVKKGGVVCRHVDLSPLYECIMHRTQSIDFGIVLEGSVELILDDGKKVLMHRGDVAVQRATIHAWRNPDPEQWSRMLFVLQDSKPLIINGKKFGEDLGPGVDGLAPSGNDD